MTSRGGFTTSQADVRVLDGRAWVLAVGPVDRVRAAGIAALVDDLAGRAALRRVSVDLTCAVPADHAAATILELLRIGAPPRVDVAGPGLLGRLLRPRGAA